MAGVPRRDYYERKYGVDAMRLTSERMNAVFEEEGLNALMGVQGYNIDGTVASSLPALRLLALAQRSKVNIWGLADARKVRTRSLLFLVIQKQ